MRRLTIGLVGGALAITACGGGSDSADSSDTPPAVAEAPAEETPADSEVTEAPASPEAGDDAPAQSDDTPPVTTPAPGAEQAEPPPSDDAGAPQPENEPTTTLAREPVPAPLGGRSLGQALRPESATGSNPLPDLLVDDIRGGTQVNVANILPSALPVLIWAWAPH